MKTEGIVIRRNDSFNSDVFLTLLTERYGKLNVVARRSKSMKSPLSASSKLFVCSIYELKAANIPSVVQASIVQSHASLMDDYDAMMYASYIAELMDKCTREEYVEPELYYLLRESLNILARHAAAKKGEKKPGISDFIPTISPQLVRVHFLARVLSELGLMPEMNHCHACGTPLNEDVFFQYDGGCLCKECHRGAGSFATGQMVRFIQYLAAVSSERLVKTNVDSLLIHRTAELLEKLLLTMADIKKLNTKDFLMHI